MARSDEIEVEGIRVTHPDRVLFEEQGLTKRDLIDHYRRVADRMLPHIEGRPLTLLRCPEGAEKKCFYQKHAKSSVPEAVGRVRIQESGAGSDGEATYMTADDLGALVALVQMGVLEIHVWGSRRNRLDRVDRMVFDLDPGPGTGFDDVVDGAKRTREILSELDLESFPLLTGSKGIHVVVPLDRHHDFDEVRGFAKGVAARLAEEDPDRYVAKASKEARKNRIFVDYLRNGWGATAIAPFSTRARTGATVAVPVGWSELDGDSGPDAHRVSNLERRLSALKGDPWKGYFAVRQRLTKESLKAVDAG